jgi:hypothetical protein
MIGRVVEVASDGCHLAVLRGFTDKQCESIISFDGRKRGPKNKNPQQYSLF